MAVKQSIQDELPRIKENISQSYMYFKDNVQRFHFWRNYIFNTSINDDQKAILASQGKPVTEFNILESYLSRLSGEFAKHEPSIEVSPAEGVPTPHEVIEIVEGHIRHVLYDANKDNMSQDIYDDSLSGGWSVGKVWTDYANPMSMKQVIKAKKGFDPTMHVFDPMARYKHKGDGKFSGELFPMMMDDFKRQFPKADASKISYGRSLEEFSWSYKNDKGQEIILICDYYEKKKLRTRIVELADGIVMPVSAYKKLPEFWEQQGFFEQIPLPVGEPRWTELETICRYKLCESEILEYEETDYQYLPHVFFDGNSKFLRQGTSNCTYQMTRPYLYQAKGIQDLKNYSGISLLNYIENQVQSKFIVMKEALPQEDDFINALTDIQNVNTIVVNAYSENNPDKPIPNPIREVINPPAPQEVVNAFTGADASAQAILGSYASNLGKNDNDLSGKAVIEASSVGNAAAMPYVVGYLEGLAQMARIMVDLMPKYLKGKRELPVVDMEGKKSYAKINQKGAPWLRYQQNALNVCIEASVNFQVQKNQALQQITSLMAVSQEFNEFMNSDICLPILIRNLTIYGADQLEEAVPKYLEMKQQKQQQAQQMQQQMMQNDPRMVKAQVDMKRAQIEEQSVQIKADEAQFQQQIDIAKVAIEKELADAKILEAEAKVTQGQIDSAVRLEEAQTSLEVHSLETAAKMAEIHSREHSKALDTHAASLAERKLEHEISQSKKKEIE